MKKYFLLLALAPSQAPLPPCRAQLTLYQDGGLLHVTGTCRSQLTQAAHYRYELRALRHSAAGQARTIQRGSFELLAQQALILAQVGLNTRADNHYHIRLLVYDSTGRAVAQDSANR